ncbi:hypothetical protein HELRODRAFT_175608 [Helobdella robusta]|uniref:B box-type domain-containing protein n=1 Tax=Helobdella robusta TaxID=6412 RepID=T1F9F2_HELRO|nr:hypothetical protein HELRODRAFT_175608 [Helobdella robusta]ESO00631.1 hypothetical protein HELRODRAFT_175608 [Helobdella robusta]
MTDPFICTYCRQLKTKFLPCKHTHCLSCLRKKYSENDKTIKCDICEEVCVRPRNLDSLPDNQFIMMLKKMEKRIIAGRSNKNCCETCGDSGERVAEKYCIHCRQHLCLSCLQLHYKFKMNQTHEVVDADASNYYYIEAINKVDYEKCPTHDQNIDIYCENCNQFICSKCIHQHERHKFKEISSKIEEDKKKIESTIAKLQKNLTIYEEKLQTLKTDLNKFEVLFEIHSRGDALKRLIDEYVQDLINHVEDSYQNFVDEGIGLQPLIREEKKFVETKISSLEETLDNLNARTVVREQYDLHVPKFQKFEVLFPEFKLNKPKTAVCHNHVNNSSNSSCLENISVDDLLGFLEIIHHIRTI